MSNKKRNLLSILTLVILVVAGIVYYLYNKPPIDVQNAEGQKVIATDLYATYSQDSARAKKIFTNKILEVSGKVTQVSGNQQHQQVILIKTNTDGAAINCTMEGPAVNIKTGQTLTIKGICNGIGEGNADMGIMADVYLVRCYISN